MYQLKGSSLYGHIVLGWSRGSPLAHRRRASGQYGSTPVVAEVLPVEFAETVAILVSGVTAGA
jgi:hypothetical protein